MHPVTKKILFPILLAAIVTVFSLKYYNTKQLEKQLAARLAFKGYKVISASEGYDKFWKKSGRSNHGSTHLRYSRETTIETSKHLKDINGIKKNTNNNIANIQIGNTRKHEVNAIGNGAFGEIPRRMHLSQMDVDKEDILLNGIPDVVKRNPDILRALGIRDPGLPREGEDVLRTVTLKRSNKIVMHTPPVGDLINDKNKPNGPTSPSRIISGLQDLDDSIAVPKNVSSRIQESSRWPETDTAKHRINLTTEHTINDSKVFSTKPNGKRLASTVPTKSPTAPSLQRIWDASVRKNNKDVNNSSHQDNVPLGLLQTTQIKDEKGQQRVDIIENGTHTTFNPRNIRNLTGELSQTQLVDKNSLNNSQHHIKQLNKTEVEKLNIWHEVIKTNTKTKPIRLNGEPTKIPNVELHSRDLPAIALRSKELNFRFKPESGKKYAVLSAVSIGNDFNYVFTLPLTVAAWKRVGYDSILLLVGEEKHWMSHPVLSYILKELRRSDPVVVFLNASTKYWVFLSQVSRVFVCELFDWRGLENTILLTSDADLWPLSKEMYALPDGKKILSLNSQCCGTFDHKGKKYKMLPMCSLVMSVGTWREVLGMNTNLSPVHPVNDMITYIEEEFGTQVLSKPVVKGENDGWFLDQHLMSVRIKQWEVHNRTDAILYAPRHTSIDRVDRSKWKPYNIERKKDVHLLENLYQPGSWERTLPLIRALFSEGYQDMVNYREGFIRMVLELKNRQQKKST